MNYLQCLVFLMLSPLSLAASVAWSASAEESSALVDPLDNCNVVWDSSSKDHNGSMPIGNGDIGMNVWVEENGDLLLLLSKTDAWSENCRLLKLGRVRVSFSPNPFNNALPFLQTLHLRQGEIEIIAGEDEKAITLKVWVDANNPVIHLVAISQSSFDIQAKLEIWRTEKRELAEKEASSAYGVHGGPNPVYVYPDTIVNDQENHIVWYHRNESSIWEDNLRHQGMADLIPRMNDPLLHRTFGGCIVGTDLVTENATTLKSQAPQPLFFLSIHPLCMQTETAEAWLEKLGRSVADNDLSELKANRTKHREWWNNFWNRSWIRVTGNPDLETLTQAYTLQRWVSACAGRGVHPIKFNGTIFTVDGAGFDADYRAWGGPYWWQNTRLPYWPMLACGDFDMMQPLFRMYQEMIPLQEFRTQTWFGHGGSFIGETVYFWGMYNNENYGWVRDKNLPVGELTNPYIRREYTASLELMAMMLDYYEYTGDETFLQKTLLPVSDSLLEFWDKHYQNDENGFMKMYPAQALETLQDAENPTTDIAGLMWVLEGLLTLPQEKATATRTTFWKHLQEKVPPLPMEQRGSRKIILGASKVFGGRGNSENPELYAVFPFRLFGVGKPDLETGRRTFERRTVKGNNGWRQDDTQAAMLGLTQIAADYIVERAKTKHTESRFPAFWGPNMDWIPDQDHGGNLMMALQSMLMQYTDDNILLFPAWPDTWDVDFKLNAPKGTIIEGTVKEGKIVTLKVSPESRMYDVEVMLSR